MYYYNIWHKYVSPRELFYFWYVLLCLGLQQASIWEHCSCWFYFYFNIFSSLWKSSCNFFLSLINWNQIHSRKVSSEKEKNIYLKNSKQIWFSFSLKSDLLIFTIQLNFFLIYDEMHSMTLCVFFNII